MASDSGWEPIGGAATTDGWEPIGNFIVNNQTPEPATIPVRFSQAKTLTAAPMPKTQDQGWEPIEAGWEPIKQEEQKPAGRLRAMSEGALAGAVMFGGGWLPTSAPGAVLGAVAGAVAPETTTAAAQALPAAAWEGITRIRGLQQTLAGAKPEEVQKFRDANEKVLYYNPSGETEKAVGDRALGAMGGAAVGGGIATRKPGWGAALGAAVAAFNPHFIENVKDLAFPLDPGESEYDAGWKSAGRAGIEIFADTMGISGGKKAVAQATKKPPTPTEADVVKPLVIPESMRLETPEMRLRREAIVKLAEAAKGEGPEISNRGAIIPPEADVVKPLVIPESMRLETPEMRLRREAIVKLAETAKGEGPEISNRGAITPPAPKQPLQLTGRIEGVGFQSADYGERGPFPVEVDSTSRRPNSLALPREIDRRTGGKQGNLLDLAKKSVTAMEGDTSVNDLTQQNPLKRQTPLATAEEMISKKYREETVKPPSVHEEPPQAEIVDTRIVLEKSAQKAPEAPIPEGGKTTASFYKESMRGEPQSGKPIPNNSLLNEDGFLDIGAMTDALSPGNTAANMKEVWADVKKKAGDIKDLSKNKAQNAIDMLPLPAGMRSQAHLDEAHVMREVLGSRKRADESVYETLKNITREFTRGGAHNDSIPLAKRITGIFIGARQDGQPMREPWANIDKQLDGINDNVLGRLEKAGIPLKHIQNNWFPQMWTRASIRATNQALRELKVNIKDDISEITADMRAKIKARAEELERKGGGEDSEIYKSLGKTLVAPSGWRKAKKYDSFKDALEFGLKPVSPNPGVMFALRRAIMMDAIDATAIQDHYNPSISRMVKQGLSAEEIDQRTSDKKVRLVPNGYNTPEGYADINDAYAKVFQQNKNGQWAQIGKRVATKPVADVLNNYLSSSIYSRQDAFGMFFRNYMDVKNGLNLSQLFGYFHLGFTTNDTQIHANTMVTKAVEGLLRKEKSVKDVAVAAKNAALEVTAWRAATRGKSVIDAWEAQPTVDIDTETPVKHLEGLGPMNLVAKAAEMAGWSFRGKKELFTNKIEKLEQAWYGGKKLTAAFHAPLAGLEIMMRPLVEKTVPRQKAGVFANYVWDILKANPNKTMKELRPEFNKAANLVDASMGQVPYDRYFMNKTALAVFQMIMRAPGWHGGDSVLAFGSLKDTAMQMAEWKRTGEIPRFTNRQHYMISMLATTAAENLTATLALTYDPDKTFAENVKTLTVADAVAFRNKQGYRFWIPSYVKTFHNYGVDFFGTLSSAAAPTIQPLIDVSRNRDYWGTRIRNKDAPLMDQAGQVGSYLLKQYIPFAGSNQARMAENAGYGSGIEGVVEAAKADPVRQMSSIVGVAPAKPNLTPAEEKIQDYGIETGVFSKSKEQTDFAKKRSALLNYFRLDDGRTLEQKRDTMPTGIKRFVNDLKNGGTRKQKQLVDIERDMKLSRLQFGFKKINNDADEGFDRMRKVWELSTPKEKESLREIFMAKLEKTYDGLDKDKQALFAQEVYKIPGLRGQ